ncbi:MAG: hypothetical protein ACI8RD_009654 [Bacillariaceae sp.]|jgi:hypothetical protein
MIMMRRRRRRRRRRSKRHELTMAQIETSINRITEQ